VVTVFPGLVESRPLIWVSQARKEWGEMKDSAKCSDPESSDPVPGLVPMLDFESILNGIDQRGQAFGLSWQPLTC
jgi:hypothetical protein